MAARRLLNFKGLWWFPSTGSLHLILPVYFPSKSGEELRFDSKMSTIIHPSDPSHFIRRATRLLLEFGYISPIQCSAGPAFCNSQQPLERISETRLIRFINATLNVLETYTDVYQWMRGHSLPTRRIQTVWRPGQSWAVPGCLGTPFPTVAELAQTWLKLK